MAEASKMELKEEKQKVDVVKKKGNLGEKLDEVTKRDERDKGGSWNGRCEKKGEKMGEENRE